jgi:hypothetical protein
MGAMGILAHDPLRQVSAIGERDVSVPVFETPTAHARLPCRAIEVSMVRDHVLVMVRGAHSAGVASAAWAMACWGTVAGPVAA